MNQLAETMLRVALVSLGLLMVPLVPSRVVIDWNWNAGAFVRVYLLFFVTGMLYGDRQENGLLGVQGGCRRSIGRRVRIGVVDHGPNGGLGTSGVPVVSQRARGGIRWGLSNTVQGSRIGSHVVRDGSRVGDDLRGAAFRCTSVQDPRDPRGVRHGAEDGHRAWCLRSVVHRVRSAVPAREFGGIEVRPRSITSRPPDRRAPRMSRGI